MKRLRRSICPIIFCFLLCLTGNIFSQEKPAAYFQLKSLSVSAESGEQYAVALDTMWKVSNKALSDSTWIQPAFDDNNWKTMPTDMFELTPAAERAGGVFCCRLKIIIDSALKNKTAALMVRQFGACDIYFNGKYLLSYGTTSSGQKLETRYNPNDIPYVFRFGAQDTQVIAVRYTNHRNWEKVLKEHLPVGGFYISAGEANDAVSDYINTLNGGVFYVTFLACLFYTLGFVHFLLFLFYRSKISNLYYSVFSFGVAIIFHLVINGMGPGNADSVATMNYWSGIIWCVIPVTLLALLYNLFYERYPLSFKIFAATYAVIVLSVVFSWKFGIYLAVIAGAASCIEYVRIVIWAIWKKKEGAWIVGSGLIGFVFLFVGSIFFVMIYYKGFQYVQWKSTGGLIVGLLYFVGIFSIPFSMSVYLARDFAATSKKLARKLKEVEELSAKTIAQAKEKQTYLETQKETLEEQVRERTAELTEQKNLIEEKQKEIIDSIRYAERIQKALITNDIYIARNLNRLANKKGKE